MEQSLCQIFKSGTFFRLRRADHAANFTNQRFNALFRSDIETG
jgi:hypothetical protein